MSNPPNEDKTLIVLNVLRDVAPFRATFVVTPAITKYDMRMMIGDPEHPGPELDQLAAMNMTEQVLTLVIKGLQHSLDELRLQREALN